MVNENREQILNDEFLRPDLPGVRIFSATVLMLCRKLELSFALPEEARRKVTPEEAEMEMLAAAWLLDMRHSREELKRAAAVGREAFFAQQLAEYEWEVTPAFMMLVRHEIKVTNAAAEAALVFVQAKPGEAGGETPPGNC